MKNKIFYLHRFAMLLLMLSISVCECVAQMNDWSNAWSLTPVPSGESTAENIVHDVSGNLYVLGGFRDSTNTHYYSTFLLKYNNTGKVIWKREFTAYGKHAVLAFGLTIDEKDNIYLCGSFEGFPVTDSANNITLLVDTIVKSAGNDDAFLMRLDTAGHTKWLQVYGGLEAEGFQSLHAYNGRVIVGGVYSDTIKIGPNIILHEQLNRQRPFLASFDTDGNPLWAKTVKSVRNLRSIFIDKSKNFYITGSFGLDLYIDNIHISSSSTGNVIETGFYAKFDSSGTCMWAKQQNGFGGPTGQGNVGVVYTDNILVHSNRQLSIAGNYYNCGIHFGSSSLSLPVNFQETPFLIRCDSNGNPIWAKVTQVDAGYNYTGGIASDSQSNVYFTGGMNLPGTFGTDSFNQNGRGKLDAFLFKYSPAGNLIWGRTAGADLEDVGYGVTLSPNESSVYMVGTARSNNPMYFGNIQVPLAGYSTLFVGKTTNAPLAIPKVIKSDFAFSVFPNPATTIINLSLPAGIAVQEATLYNTIGSLVFQWSGLLPKTELSLRFPELPAGTYTLLVRSTAGTQSHCKVVINP